MNNDKIALQLSISKHGEYGIALEKLCSILEERKIFSNKAAHSLIVELLRDMDFSEDAIEYYRSRLLVKG